MYNVRYHFLARYCNAVRGTVIPSVALPVQHFQRSSSSVPISPTLTSRFSNASEETRSQAVAPARTARIDALHPRQPTERRSQRVHLRLDRRLVVRLKRPLQLAQTLAANPSRYVSRSCALLRRAVRRRIVQEADDNDADVIRGIPSKRLGAQLLRRSLWVVVPSQRLPREVHGVVRAEDIPETVACDDDELVLVGQSPPLHLGLHNERAWFRLGTLQPLDVKVAERARYPEVAVDVSVLHKTTSSFYPRELGRSRGTLICGEVHRAAEA